jgi:hypothetical protein
VNTSEANGKKGGLELKEIEERTKIPAQTLIFLEENQLDMLPPRTFLRGSSASSAGSSISTRKSSSRTWKRRLPPTTINKQVKEPSYRAKPVMPMIVLVAAAALIVIVLFVFSLRQCTAILWRTRKRGMDSCPGLCLCRNRRQSLFHET